MLGGEKQRTVPNYTRKDFLRFDVATRGDDTNITDHWNTEDVEKEADWYDYGDWED